MALLSASFKHYDKDTNFAATKRIVIQPPEVWDALMRLLAAAKAGTLPTKAPRKGKQKEGEPAPPVVSTFMVAGVFDGLRVLWGC